MKIYCTAQEWLELKKALSQVRALVTEYNPQGDGFKCSVSYEQAPAIEYTKPNETLIDIEGVFRSKTKNLISVDIN